MPSKAGLKKLKEDVKQLRAIASRIAAYAGEDVEEEEETEEEDSEEEEEEYDEEESRSAKKKRASMKAALILGKYKK